MTALVRNISVEDFQSLLTAYEALEHPSLAARLSSVLGVPLDRALVLLPRRWNFRIRQATETAIGRATRLAVSSLQDSARQPAGDGVHRGMAAASGAVGGFFGLPALVLELPLTTVLMLRSIASIARSHGEDLESPETGLACLAVFAFGGRTRDDDYAEIGYYEVRSALALHFSAVLDRMMTLGPGVQKLPATVEVIRTIAARFGVVVSDKAAAQLVPFAGAAAGALVNTIFMQHFQSTAHGHFTIRRLERKYGRGVIESAYAEIARSEGIPRYTDNKNFRVRPSRASAA